MRFIKYLLVAIVAFIIIWIDIPRSIPINIGLFGKEFKTTIAPPTINAMIFGKPVYKEFKTLLGLDLQGGSNLVFETDTTKVPAADLEDALNSSRDVIERRVNLFGVSEPSVRTVKTGDKYRISVELPGVQNVAEAAALIGQTAQLSFREQDETAPEATNSALIFMNLTKETGLTGKEVKKATVTFDQNNGQPQVALAFSETGAKQFAAITSRNVGKPVGIYIDEILISAPTVQQSITDGNAVISGSFTTDDAKQLAVAINSGALPLPIKLVEQRNIGPSLGAVEVQRSVTAGMVGLGMVMLFMILFYGRLGLIACAGLIIYGLITFAIFRAIPVVLTLPGIAGFLISIGMAVDSNILIFERIKEERRKGKPLETAIRLGFGRAIDAIKDANITTLLVAFILFNPLNWEFLPQFGLIRGFALTLAIGVATSLFTGIVVTKRLIKTFYLK
ncbi:MAG: protein translocase subunit SecD [Weeksellaceae bacterium]